MKIMSLFFLTFMVFVIGADVAISSDCQKIMQSFIKEEIPKEVRSDKGKIEKKIEPYYLFSNREVYPVKSVSRENIYGHQILEVFYSDKMSYTVQVHSFIESKQKFQNEGFYADYKRQVESNIDYVIATYEKRRGWSSEFLADVKKQAIRDADRTQYIVVKSNDFKKEDEIWGTLKVVRSRENNSYEELLPLEEALNVRLPFNNGFKFEPGNFAIDKEHYKEAMSQVLLHLSRSVKQIMKENHAIRPDEPLFYTYADRESRLMYKSLGFKVAKNFEKAISKDGRDWWVLSISGKDLADLPLRLKNSRNVWSDSDQELFNEIVHLFESINGDAVVEKNLATNTITSDLLKRPDTVIFTRSEEHLHRGSDVQKMGLIFNHFGEDGEMSLPIPSSKLPLEEGDEISFRMKEMKAIYKNGVLNFNYEFNGEVVEFELIIDPHLSSPKKLKFKKEEDGRVKIEFEATFNGSL